MSHMKVLVHTMKYGAPGTPTILAPVGGYTMFYNNGCGNYNCSTNCCTPCYDTCSSCNCCCNNSCGCNYGCGGCGNNCGCGWGNGCGNGCGCGWGNGGCGGFGLIGALVGLAILGSVFGCGGCW
ncbi:MAG: hypothetical protein HFI72_07085 [Peptococcaceae bacterium]|nr:hypothetical protein [Peptococcaceae bacterium]